MTGEKRLGHNFGSESKQHAELPALIHPENSPAAEPALIARGISAVGSDAVEVSLLIPDQTEGSAAVRLSGEDMEHGLFAAAIQFEYGSTAQGHCVAESGSIATEIATKNRGAVEIAVSTNHQASLRVHAVRSFENMQRRHFAGLGEPVH